MNINYIFLGKKGSGKSTSANYVLKNLEDQGAVKFSFADPLKRTLSNFMGVDLDYFYNQTLKEKPLELNNYQKAKAVFILNYAWVSSYKRDKATIEEDLQNYYQENFSLDNYIVKLWQVYGGKYSEDLDGVNVTPRDLMVSLGTYIFRDIDPDFWIKTAEKEIKAINVPIVFDDIRFENELKVAIKGFSVVLRIENPRSFFVHENDLTEKGVKFPCPVIENSGTIDDLYKKIDVYIKNV